MASRYLWIVGVGNPFSYGVDANGDTLWSANFDTFRVPDASQRLEYEILQILTDAGLATVNVDTWCGPKPITETGSGPYSQIIATGGMSPMQTHNGDLYRRDSIQIVTRAKSTNAGSTRINSIWSVLNAVSEQSVTVTVV